MPQRFAMRRFKAVVFEALSYPATVKLLNGLSCSRPEPSILRKCFEMTEHGADDHGTELSRLLNDPFLQQAIAQLGEGPAWAVVLSNPLRIAILESLCKRVFEEDELSEEIQDQEQGQIGRDLDILVRSGLVSRRVESGEVLCGIKEDSIRTVLGQLRKSFENNLADALALISDISCQAHSRRVGSFEESFARAFRCLHCWTL